MDRSFSPVGKLGTLRWPTWARQVVPRGRLSPDVRAAGRTALPPHPDRGRRFRPCPSGGGPRLPPVRRGGLLPRLGPREWGLSSLGRVHAGRGRRQLRLPAARPLPPDAGRGAPARRGSARGGRPRDPAPEAPQPGRPCGRGASRLARSHSPPGRARGATGRDPGRGLSGLLRERGALGTVRCPVDGLPDGCGGGAAPRSARARGGGGGPGPRHQAARHRSRALPGALDLARPRRADARAQRVGRPRRRAAARPAPRPRRPRGRHAEGLHRSRELLPVPDRRGLQHLVPARPLRRAGARDEPAGGTARRPAGARARHLSPGRPPCLLALHARAAGRPGAPAHPGRPALDARHAPLRLLHASHPGAPALRRSRGGNACAAGPDVTAGLNQALDLARALPGADAIAGALTSLDLPIALRTARDLGATIALVNVVLFAWALVAFWREAIAAPDAGAAASASGTA